MRDPTKNQAIEQWDRKIAYALTLEEVEKLAREGIEIPLDQVRILYDGTLAYKGRRIVLYIRDVKQYGHGAHTEQDLPRFHVANCDTLQKMRANNRYGRYVVATRDEGVFEIRLKPSNSNRHQISDRRLRVCQSCLDRLNWNDFRSKRQNTQIRNEIVQSFTLPIYFSKYGRTFVDQVPQHTEETAPLNDYTKDFSVIAERIKSKRNYRCDKCEIDLSRNRKFLHAHHKNGVQSDNRESNIAILCIRDHADQHLHGHMRQLPEYREFMKLLVADRL